MASGGPPQNVTRGCISLSDYLQVFGEMLYTMSPYEDIFVEGISPELRAAKARYLAQADNPEVPSTEVQGQRRSVSHRTNGSVSQSHKQGAVEIQDFSRPPLAFIPTSNGVSGAGGQEPATGRQQMDPARDNGAARTSNVQRSLPMLMNDVPKPRVGRGRGSARSNMTQSLLMGACPGAPRFEPFSEPLLPPANATTNSAFQPSTQANSLPKRGVGRGRGSATMSSFRGEYPGAAMPRATGGGMTARPEAGRKPAHLPSKQAHGMRVEGVVGHGRASGTTSLLGPYRGTALPMAIPTAMGGRMAPRPDAGSPLRRHGNQQKSKWKPGNCQVGPGKNSLSNGSGFRPGHGHEAPPSVEHRRDLCSANDRRRAKSAAPRSKNNKSGEDHGSKSNSRAWNHRKNSSKQRRGMTTAGSASLSKGDFSKEPVGGCQASPESPPIDDAQVPHPVVEKEVVLTAVASQAGAPFLVAAPGQVPEPTREEEGVLPSAVPFEAETPSRIAVPDLVPEPVAEKGVVFPGAPFKAETLLPVTASGQEQAKTSGTEPPQSSLVGSFGNLSFRRMAKSVDRKDSLSWRELVTYEHLEVGRVVDVAVLAEPHRKSRMHFDFGGVVCELKDEGYEQANQFEAEVAAAGKKISASYIPHTGDLVLAPYEGVYYRAVALDATTVWFLDYGNVDKIDLGDMKRMPQELMARPPTCHLFKIHGPHSKLDRIITGKYKFVVKGVEDGGKVYIVDFVDEI